MEITIQQLMRFNSVITERRNSSIGVIEFQQLLRESFSIGNNYSFYLYKYLQSKNIISIKKRKVISPLLKSEEVLEGLAFAKSQILKSTEKPKADEVEITAAINLLKEKGYVVLKKL